MTARKYQSDYTKLRAPAWGRGWTIELVDHVEVSRIHKTDQLSTIHYIH
jgi:hypothetical protein